MSRGWFVGGYAMLAFFAALVAFGIALSVITSSAIGIGLGIAFGGVGGYYATRVLLSLMGEGWWTA